MDIDSLSKFKIYQRGDNFYVAHNGEHLKIYSYFYSTQPYHWSRGHGIYVLAEASDFARGKEYLVDGKVYYQFTYPASRVDSFKPYWSLADVRTIWGTNRYKSYLKECSVKCMTMMYHLYSKPSEPMRLNRSKRSPFNQIKINKRIK